MTFLELFEDQTEREEPKEREGSGGTRGREHGGREEVQDVRRRCPTASRMGGGSKREAAGGQRTVSSLTGHVREDSVRAVSRDTQTAGVTHVTSTAKQRERERQSTNVMTGSLWTRSMVCTVHSKHGSHKWRAQQHTHKKKLLNHVRGNYTNLPHRDPLDTDPISRSRPWQSVERTQLTLQTTHCQWEPPSRGLCSSDRHLRW